MGANWEGQLGNGSTRRETSTVQVATGLATP